MIVVASIKYPPHNTHMRWGLSSVIFILVVRCILSRKKTGKGRKTWTERQEKVKCNGKERPFGEELYAWLRWGGHIVFYANSATIRCGRFTVSNYLEHPINTNQSQWWSSMVGKNSKRRTRTAEILYLNCHLIKMRFEISHHLSLLKQRL